MKNEDSIKIGDVIWQARMPGGLCLVLDIIEEGKGNQNDRGWLSTDYPIYVVCHPSEGVINDPSYYFHTLEEDERLRSRVWKDHKIIGHTIDGKFVPIEYTNVHSTKEENND